MSQCLVCHMLVFYPPLFDPLFSLPVFVVLCWFVCPCSLCFLILLVIVLISPPQGSFVCIFVSVCLLNKSYPLFLHLSPRTFNLPIPWHLNILPMQDVILQFECFFFKVSFASTNYRPNSAHYGLSQCHLNQ